MAECDKIRQNKYNLNPADSLHGESQSNAIWESSNNQAPNGECVVGWGRALRPAWLQLINQSAMPLVRQVLGQGTPASSVCSALVWPGKALGESISFHWHGRKALLGSKGCWARLPGGKDTVRREERVGTGHSGLRGFLKEGSLKQTWVVSSREPHGCRVGSMTRVPGPGKASAHSLT